MIILASLVLLLVSVSGAQAECAWVLWNEYTYLGLDAAPSSMMTVIAASPSYDQCEQGRIAKARSLRQVTDSDRSGPNVSRLTTEENGNIVTKVTHLKDGRRLMSSYRLSCLPDTIDPRGPKGK